MSSDVQPAAPAPVTTPNWLQRIGIISGHRGLSRNNIGNDPGAVCEDGLEEADINFEVARRVVDNLRARNYTVDLLDEFDAPAGQLSGGRPAFHSCQHLRGFWRAGFRLFGRPRPRRGLTGGLTLILSNASPSIMKNSSRWSAVTT